MKTSLIFAALVACAASAFGAIDGKTLTIGNPGGGGKTAPYFYATNDAAGYSDWIWYGPSEEHEVAKYHEVLSGEWGAAIYYDGIATAVMDPNAPDTSRQAMWLTKQFTFPNWSTNSDFSVSGPCAAWHDPNNPAPLVNRGRSVIENGTVEITIDYEVVDLAFLDPNTYPLRSPMGYLDADTGSLMYAASDRYCFLQTYTIRNIDPNGEPVANMEFYQLLHSHGADEYGGAVNSTYTDVAAADPLEYYTPYNPAHQVGNFRYDITQWNSDYGIAATVDHADFVSFSSVRQPDWYDNDVYKGGHSYYPYKPPLGTHIHVENRMLNSVPAIYYDEVCGAMGWALGSLDPNETTSLTIAYMFGMAQAGTPALGLSKEVDPSGCVSPNDEITYTLRWENNSEETAEDVVLVDYLPVGVWFEAGWDRVDANFVLIPADPNFSQEDHTYTWTLGDVNPNESGCVSLTVKVDYRSEPGMTFTNEARFVSTNLGTTKVELKTNVCCWGGDVIYVDARATGYNNGISWEHAYTDLQRALTRAAVGCGAEIWMAEGTYDPARLPEESFVIPENVALYGGFVGNETARDQRNPDRYKTILTGGVDAERNETVVTMGDNSVLDGFTVREASGDGYGIYGNGVDFMVANCRVVENATYGIYGTDGDVAITWSVISGSARTGVYHAGDGCSIAIDNATITENLQWGLLCEQSTPVIKNTVVAGNGYDVIPQQGIRIVTPGGVPVLYNNTITRNAGVGLSWFDDFGSGPDPNVLDYPDIQNCILWYNNDDDAQLAGYSFTQYSCVFDAEDAEGTDYTLDAYGNFSGRPVFIYEGIDDPNVVLDVHLAADSPCRDAGSPSLSYTGQVDFDDEGRVSGTYVDIGADEVDDECSSVFNEVDWNWDAVVNMLEWGRFRGAWQSIDPNFPPLIDPNHPDHAYYSDPNSSGYIDPETTGRWQGCCNFNDDYVIDVNDFAPFCENYMWMACWKQSRLWRFGEYAGMYGGESMSAMVEDTALVAVAQEGEPSVPEAVTSYILGVHGVLEYLDAQIDKAPPNLEALYDIKAFLIECLEEAKASVAH